MYSLIIDECHIWNLNGNLRSFANLYVKFLKTWYGLSLKVLQTGNTSLVRQLLP